MTSLPTTTRGCGSVIDPASSTLADGRYFAVGRAETDGHAFVFDHLDDRGYPNGNMRVSGWAWVDEEAGTKTAGRAQ